jgi:DNA-binding Lrp family transcriptional regulator
MRVVDPTDARLLLALVNTPRAPVLSLAHSLNMSRNTVAARLARLAESGSLRSFEHCISPEALGYPLTAFITAVLTQRSLNEVGHALADIPQVIEVFGVSGPSDLLIRVVARDADELYRIAGQILALDGVVRTETALTMRRMVEFRVRPLLDEATD